MPRTNFITEKAALLLNILRKTLPDHVNEAQGFDRYFKSTSWLFAEKAIRLFLTLFVSVWVARYLGPSKFGLLNYAISFVALFAALASMGVDNILVRELTRNPEGSTKLLGSAFVLKLFGSIGAFLLVVTCCLNMEGNSEQKLIVLVAAFSLLMHPFLIFELYFRSIVLSQYYAWSTIFALTIGAALRILFILFSLPVIFFASVLTAELAVTALSLFYFYWQREKRIDLWHFSKKTLIDLFYDSWPLLFSSAMISIYMRIDQVMIQHMLDARSVGYYSAAVRISEAWYFIPMVICQSVLPSIIKTRDVDQKLYSKRLESLFGLMVVISLSVAIPSTLLAGFFVPLLYGPEYAPSATVFKIHIWAGIFVSIGVASANWLLAENFQKYYLVCVTIGAITNIITNYFLIPILSFNGAALTTVLSYFVSSYLCLSFFQPTRYCFKLLSRSFLIHRLLLKGTRNDE